jgi:pumilio family protein 6
METDDVPSSEAHLLSLSHSVRTYKLLLSGGHFNASTKSIDIVDPALPAQFATAVWEAITSEYAGGNDNAVKVAAGAPFVVVEMLAALPESEAKAAKKVLGAKSAREVIEASEAKGASLLLERLA